jgi:hypothetical protein
MVFFFSHTSGNGLGREQTMLANVSKRRCSNHMPLPYVWRQGQKLLASGAESFGASTLDSRTRARRTPSSLEPTWKPLGDSYTPRKNTTLTYLCVKRPPNFPLYIRPTTRTEAAFSRRPHRRPAVHTLMWKGSCTAAHSSSQRAWCDQLRFK